MTHLDYNKWDLENKIKYLSWIPKDVKTVLDVGCGRGEFLSLIASKYEAYGCDVDANCVKFSSKFAEVKLADILHLSNYYKQNSFDLVTAFHILEHLSCPLKALQEIGKVTKKYILIAIPNARCVIWKELSTHLYSWNRYTLKNIMERAGFSLKRISEDRINIFPRWLRLSPIINRILLKIIIAPNELIALGIKK